MSDGVERESSLLDGGQSVLLKLANEMVRAHKAAHGRGPDQTKAYMLDDLLFVVMRGSLLPVEQTMLDAGRDDAVRRFRQEFENEMAGRLVSTVEDVTGRRVVNSQSQIMFDPPIVVQMFVFDDMAGPAEQAVPEP